MAIFSVIIYAWPFAVAPPTERIEAMIGDVVLPEEGRRPRPRTSR